MSDPLTGKELRSLIGEDGTLRISLEPITIEEPGPGEVVVRVQATPINPSDLALLLGPADMATLRHEGDALVADVPEQRLGIVRARLGQSLAVGNEGAGEVVRAGPDLQGLIGRSVSLAGGGMYAQYRRAAIRDCMLLPEGAPAIEGASLVVNPLTALGFTETMRAEGHKAIVHTAAASNLGQMLLRICRADRIPLVNIVRSEAQVALLREAGAEHVVNSSDPEFMSQLTEAVAATGATIGFDAIGGGKLTGQMLAAMEAAASRSAESYSRYGSNTHKQVYIYGALDLGPTILTRNFGFAWGLGGWLLTPFLQRAAMETMMRLRERVLAERNTTFASHYSATIGLADMLNPDIVRAFERKATGEKYLLDPSR